MVNRVLKYVPLSIVLVAIVVLTRYNYFGDTPGYVQNVADFDRGSFAPGENPLWDSGHLLLRPFGWVLFRILRYLAPHAFGADPRLAICWGLIASSVLSGLVTVILLRSLAARFLKSGWAADFVAVGFLCFYSFLNYLQTGTSYIVGLMWLTLSVFFAIRAAGAGNGIRNALLSGVAAALATLFWLPYICALAGVMAALVLWPQKSDRRHLRLAGLCAVSTVVIVGAVYLAVVLHLQLHSLPEIGRWMLASGHGSSPSKRLLRIWTGLPRSFLWLGNEGMLLKRYVLRDPYAPVTLAMIAREELWRLVAFYGFVLALLWALLSMPDAKRMLAILGSAALPLFFFALVIFEPGSAERYLPLFPFLCIAVAFALSRPASRVAQTAIVAFLCVAIVANIAYLWRASLVAQTRPTEQRAIILRDRVGSKGLVALVTFMDELYPFAGSLSFDPFAPVQIHLPVYDVIQVGNQRILTWRQEFAQKVIAAFTAGDCVWVSKRLLAERPLPQWAWTEGDDARIRWRDLRPFFSQFDYSSDIGGPDGFLGLRDSEQNRRILSAILHPPIRLSDNAAPY